MTTQLTRADALESVHRDRVLAERALRRSELERDQTARALEFNLRPMALDEAGRNRLRIAYADAAASVAENQDAFDRAVAIEQAAKVLAAALEESGSDAAEDLLDLLVARQPGRRREAAIRGRVALGSAPRAGRGARRQDSQPQ